MATRRDVERARNSINTSLTPSALSERVTADLDVVKDAYDTASISLTELSKALCRIDAIAAQEGSGAAVKAFREIAAAQKDIASTLIALRAEGRTTIRETLAAAHPPQDRDELGDGMVSPPAQKFPPSREGSLISNSEIAMGSDSAPVANNELHTNHRDSALPTKKEPAPGGAGLLVSPLSEYLKANRSPK
jgi:hypothetical protein